MLVDIDKIQVHKRVRKDMGNLDTLKDSMKRYGLLNPITLTRNYELVAGQRRLEAAKQLGWISIQANLIETEDPVTLLELELEENTQRSDFNDMELLEGYQQLEKLRYPGFFQRIKIKIKELFTRLFGKHTNKKKQDT